MCWGLNSHGQLGIDGWGEILQPTSPVIGLTVANGADNILHLRVVFIILHLRVAKSCHIPHASVKFIVSLLS